MSVCTCIGPIGNCPCIRRARGEVVISPEPYISNDVWESMPEEDRKTITDLKFKAALSFVGKRKESDRT